MHHGSTHSSHLSTWIWVPVPSPGRNPPVAVAGARSWYKGGSSKVGKAQMQSSSTPALEAPSKPSPLFALLFARGCAGGPAEQGPLALQRTPVAIEADRKMAELMSVQVPYHQVSKIRIRHSRPQNVTNGEKMAMHYPSSEGSSAFLQPSQGRVPTCEASSTLLQPGELCILFVLEGTHCSNCDTSGRFVSMHQSSQGCP